MTQLVASEGGRSRHDIRVTHQWPNDSPAISDISGRLERTQLPPLAKRQTMTMSANQVSTACMAADQVSTACNNQPTQPGLVPA